MQISWRSYPYLIRRTLASAFFRNNCLGVAKAAAYSALLSFFPVLTSAAAVLVQTRAEFVSRVVSQFLFEVIPPGTEDVVRYQFAEKGQRSIVLLILAVALSLWAASGVVRSLMQGFHVAYRLKTARPILRDAGVSIALVLAAVGPLIAASTLILFGGFIDSLAIGLFSSDPLLEQVTVWWRVLSRVGRYAVAFSGSVAVTTILYYYGPNRKQQWRLVWRGAVAATVLWLLTTACFGWYVRNLANYNVLYGSVGTSIALLVWMYLMSLIALLGCEFNAAYERLLEL